MNENITDGMTVAQDMGQKGMDFLLDKGPGILGAIITLIIGLWIIGRIVKMTEKIMVSRNMDASLIPFLKSLLNIILKAVLIISAAGMIGIETTSFIAILGAAGLAVGLALQGTLQNFAGGVLILIFKPYKVGDLVNTQGHLGVVKEIQIFVSILLTPENKTVIIPNGAISNGDITNFTVEGVIRVDLVMGISYDSDIKAARKALMEVMEAHPLVLKDPAPFVGVVELGDSAVNLAVRPYADPNNYWDVYFDIYESGKEALDKAGINIPFPQIDVHMDK
jgi:small conductance mechanosensitive channel